MATAKLARTVPDRTSLSDTPLTRPLPNLSAGPGALTPVAPPRLMRHRRKREEALNAAATLDYLLPGARPGWWGVAKW